MSSEMEAATLDAGGGWLRWRRKHADVPVGAPCANCGTTLEGAYCHSCGQLAESFHRSIWHLIVEAVESLLHLDGRLFNTLPRLVREPGRLTHDYLNGKRASQVAPFRMFLVILLIVLFVAHAAQKAGEGHEAGAPGETHAAVNVHTPADPEVQADLAKTRAEIEADADLSPAEKQAALAAVDGNWAEFGRQMAIHGTAQGAGGEQDHVISVSDDDSARMKSFKHWAEARIQAIKDDPERFNLILEIWLHRVAILALPVSALMLSLLFVFNRGFFVFDHLIFSMHSLSFQMLLTTVILLLGMVVGGWAWWLVWAMPVHLFLHMRGVYRRSIFGTLARMFVLFVMTSVTFSLLALLWGYLAFNEMAGH